MRDAYVSSGKPTDCQEHEWERRIIFGSRAWIKTCVRCGLIDMSDKGVLGKEPVAAP